MRRGEKSRLSFQVNVIQQDGNDDNNNNDQEVEENEENEKELLLGGIKMQTCFDSYHQSCCLIKESKDRRQCVSKDLPQLPSSYISFFQNIEFTRHQNAPTFKNEIDHQEANTNNDRNGTSTTTTAFLQNWEKVYDPEEFSITEYSGTFVLNWTARLRHSKHHEVTLWDLLLLDNDEEDKNQKLTTSIFDASNFSQKEIEEKICSHQTSSSSSCLNTILNKIIENRQRESTRLENHRNELLLEIQRLQNLNEEEKKTNPNSVQQWNEKQEELQFAKMQTEVAEVDWDRHFLLALYGAFSDFIITDDKNINKTTTTKDAFFFSFPFSQSIDFDVPSDVKSLPFLKNILSSSSSSSKVNDLEVSVSFIRVKLLVTKRKKRGKNSNENDADGVEDIHVKEVRVSTSYLFENDFDNKEE